MPSADLKLVCLEALDDLKAQDILVLDISAISGFADSMIIATASSSRNAKAIASNVIQSVKAHHFEVIGTEGQDESEWVLIDCGDVVVNVMQKETRVFYDLESLWGEATLITE